MNDDGEKKMQKTRNIFLHIFISVDINIRKFSNSRYGKYVFDVSGN